MPLTDPGSRTMPARPEGGAIVYAAGAAVLAGGGVLVALLGDRSSIPMPLVALVVAGASLVGLLVGYSLGYYADRGGRGGRGGRSGR
jgi:membrane protein DedA with SNARE-associated domain